MTSPDVFCLVLPCVRGTAYSLGFEGTLLIGMAVLCSVSRPHHGKKFHSLTHLVSFEPDVGLFHVMPPLGFHTHPFLGTPKSHIFGRDGE